MENRLVIGGAGRHTEKFKNTTLKGVLFLIKPSTSGSPAAARDLVDVWDKLTVEIKDNSDLNNPVQVLPSQLDLETIIDVQSAQNLVLRESYKQLLYNDMYAVPIFFETNKVLKGDANIDISVSISSWTNFLGVTVLPIESIGLEAHKYVVEEIVCDATKKRQKIDLGSAVDRIVYIGDFTNIARLKFESDILNFEKEKGEIFIPSYVGFDGGIDINGSLNETYPIVLASRSESSPPLYNAVMELDFSSTPSGSLYVIRKITTPELANDFVKKTIEHENENRTKVSVSNLADCGCKH